MPCNNSLLELKLRCLLRLRNVSHSRNSSYSAQSSHVPNALGGVLSPYIDIHVPKAFWNDRSPCIVKFVPNVSGCHRSERCRSMMGFVIYSCRIEGGVKVLLAIAAASFEQRCGSFKGRKSGKRRKTVVSNIFQMQCDALLFQKWKDLGWD